MARATIPERERIEFFRRLGRRFLVVALGAAAVLAATGVDMATDRLASWSALSDTEWGRLILAKTILFTTAILLALTHGLILGPRTRRLRASLLASPGDRALEAQLGRTAAASGIVQVVILAETIAILVLAADLIG